MVVPGSSVGHEGPCGERLLLLPGAKAALNTTALALVLPQCATWLCSLGKAVMGHFAVLAINSPRQLPGLPVPYNNCGRKCPGPRGKASKPKLTQLI